MNITIEKLLVMAIEFKDVLQIKDAFVLGIYIFLKMEMEQGEYTVPVIIDKMAKQFDVSEKKILTALKVIIDELGLVNMAQPKE